MDVTSREYLFDKNGCRVGGYSTTDFTWAGTSSIWSTSGFGTWSVPMAQKMNPPRHKRYLSKLINRKGFRDTYE